MIKIIHMVINRCNQIRWNNLKWKKIGESYVGNDFTVVSPERISIGDKFYAENNLSLQAWTKYQNQIFTPEIEIGDNVSMMGNCQISCCNRIIIGDGCLFGDNVFITDNFHGDNSREQLKIPPISRPLYVKGEVKIGKNVWIGRNVTFTPGRHVRMGSVIGACCLLCKDFPEYSIIGGNPSKLIRSRLDKK